MDYDLTPAEKKATKEDWIKLIKQVCWLCKQCPVLFLQTDPYESQLLNAQLDLERVGDCTIEEKIVKLCVEEEGWFYSWVLEKNQDVEKREKVLSKKESREAVEKIMKLIREIPLEFYEDRVSIDNVDYFPTYDLEEDYDKAMASLSYREREIIRMIVYEKLTQREIAKKLKITQPAVFKIYHSAVGKLQIMLKKYIDFEAL